MYKVGQISWEMMVQDIYHILYCDMTQHNMSYLHPAHNSKKLQEMTGSKNYMLCVKH